jgi:hypothetical protein
MKKINFLIIALLFFVATYSQVKYELGKVTTAELEEKTHPKDSSAVAAFLFNKGKTYFNYKQGDGFFVYTEVEVKIKIYKKEGYDWANKSVAFYVEGNSDESVTFSKAFTYNLVNGKIEKTKLKSESEFVEKTNKYYSQKKIVMPNVKEGSIIEYMYLIKSPFITNLPTWEFQKDIPVNHSEFSFNTPEYFTYKPIQKGFYNPEYKSGYHNETITFTNVDRSAIYSGSASRTTQDVTFEVSENNFVIDNVPALVEEDFVNNINNYRSLVSYEHVATRYPNSTATVNALDWDGVVKTIYNYDNFGPELAKSGYFESDIKTLMAGLTTQEEKIVAILNFVKSKVKWNGMNGYSCNEGVKNAYKTNTGNTAEINLMLTAMLRYAGISANPVLVSTRANGIAYFPIRTAFNYVIAAVEIQDGLILLDATEKYSYLNILPVRDINWFGRIIRENGTSAEVDLMPKLVAKEAVNMSLVINGDGTVQGKIKSQLSNHLALSFRQSKLSLTKDAYLENLENKNNNIDISEYVRENETDLSKPIVENYTFSNSKDIDVINDKIYISPMLFLATNKNPFTKETREYPIDFGYPVESKYYISITIPEGYAVESLPKALSLSTGENVGSFKYIIGNTDRNIQIVVSESLMTPIVQSDFYPVLKDFFKQMVEKENEKIVLKKL